MDLALGLGNFMIRQLNDKLDADLQFQSQLHLALLFFYPLIGGLAGLRGLDGRLHLASVWDLRVEINLRPGGGLSEGVAGSEGETDSVHTVTWRITHNSGKILLESNLGEACHHSVFSPGRRTVVSQSWRTFSSG